MNLNNKKQIFLEDYFNEEIVSYSQYSAYRAIASYTDGLKNSQRKMVYTTTTKMKDKMEKVSRLAATISLETEYLHGETSLEGAIVGMVRNWDKNISIYEEKGKFGSRTMPKAASSRYIYTKRSVLFTSIYPDSFQKIYIPQTFEGNKIEPKTMVSILPMILINGNSGVGSGYSQNILAHDLDFIIEKMEQFLKSKVKDLSKKEDIIMKEQIPVMYPGFRGRIITKVESEGQQKTYFSGVIKKKNTTTVEITELPIGYTIDTYVKILEQMIDKKQIIDYKDMSRANNFKYEIKIKRDVLKGLTENIEEGQTISKLEKFFKLEKTQVENFVTTTEDNSFYVFKNANEILLRYIYFTLSKIEDLKKEEIREKKEDIYILSEKARFIELVINDKIKISKQKRKEVEKSLKKNNFKEYLYDVLLSMRIYNLTEEDFEKLKKEEEKQKKELKKLEETTKEKYFLNFIEQLKKDLAKIKK